jgi:hypothetical protein
MRCRLPEFWSPRSPEQPAIISRFSRDHTVWGKMVAQPLKVALDPIISEPKPIILPDQEIEVVREEHSLVDTSLVEGNPAIGRESVKSVTAERPSGPWNSSGH